MPAFTNSISSALKRFLKGVPLEWIAPVLVEYLVDSLKNPKSVKEAGKFLIPLRDKLIEKYPLD